MDGINPSGTLIFDASANLYGVTLVGGLNGQGTVFELTATATGSWTETVLHDFSSQSTDGANPNAGLIFGVSGKLYPTTGQGGSGQRRDDVRDQAVSMANQRESRTLSAKY